MNSLSLCETMLIIAIQFSRLWPSSASSIELLPSLLSPTQTSEVEKADRELIHVHSLPFDSFLHDISSTAKLSKRQKTTTSKRYRAVIYDESLTVYGLQTKFNPTESTLDISLKVPAHLVDPQDTDIFDTRDPEDKRIYDIQLDFAARKGKVKLIKSITGFSGTQQMQFTDRLFLRLGMRNAELFDISAIPYRCDGAKASVPTLFLRAFQGKTIGWYEQSFRYFSDIDYRELAVEMRRVHDIPVPEMQNAKLGPTMMALWNKDDKCVFKAERCPAISGWSETPHKTEDIPCKSTR